MHICVLLFKSRCKSCIIFEQEIQETNYGTRIIDAAR